ncbi:MAG: cytochrome c biogenesis CcdA family protein [Patescibacteria group bacterium]
MIEFGLALIISSFIAGVLTFFAPCTLPLVPAFLGVISGVRGADLNNIEKLKNYRWRIFSNALFYVLGFSLIFVLFGISFSFLGKIAVIRLLIQRIGGVLIILFGLFLLGWLKIGFLNTEKQIRVPKLLESASRVNSFGIGALFALGWSPCVGPLLGSILLLAANSATIVQGTFLLIVFSIGLAIPFLLTALLIGKAFTAFSRWSGIINTVNKIAGVFLIALGFLLVSNQFSSVFSFLIGYFSRLQFYEEFINRFF